MLAVTGFMATVIARAVAKPLSAAALAAQRIAAGDLAQPVSFDGTDESAQIAQAVEQIRTNVLRLLEDTQSLPEAPARVILMRAARLRIIRANTVPLFKV